MEDLEGFTELKAGDQDEYKLRSFNTSLVTFGCFRQIVEDVAAGRVTGATKKRKAPTKSKNTVTKKKKTETKAKTKSTKKPTLKKKAAKKKKVTC